MEQRVAREKEIIKWHRHNTGRCEDDGSDCSPNVTPASNCRVHTSEAPQHTDNKDHLLKDSDKSNGVWLKTVGSNGFRAPRAASDRHMLLVVLLTSIERDHKGGDRTLRRAYESKHQKEKCQRSGSSQGNRKTHNFRGKDSDSRGGKSESRPTSLQVPSKERQFFHPSRKHQRYNYLRRCHSRQPDRT